jgi:hypothetical protein
MTDYRPEFENMPPGTRIDTSHADYKRLVALAEREGLTQKQFSAALGYEAERAMRAAPKAAAAAPAPAPAKVPAADWDRMSTRQQFAHSLANGPTRQKQG